MFHIHIYKHILLSLRLYQVWGILPGYVKIGNFKAQVVSSKDFKNICISIILNWFRRPTNLARFKWRVESFTPTDNRRKSWKAFVVFYNVDREAKNVQSKQNEVWWVTVIYWRHLFTERKGEKRFWCLF